MARRKISCGPLLCGGSPRRTRIPPPAGLTAASYFQSSLREVAPDASAFDRALDLHRLPPGGAFAGPDKPPRPLEALRRQRPSVRRIVVLAKPAIETCGLATVVAAGRFALQDVHPAHHRPDPSERLYKRPAGDIPCGPFAGNGSPGRTRTYNLAVNSRSLHH